MDRNSGNFRILIKDGGIRIEFIYFYSNSIQLSQIVIGNAPGVFFFG